MLDFIIIREEVILGNYVNRIKPSKAIGVAWLTVAIARGRRG